MMTEDAVTSLDGIEIRFDHLGEGRPALVFVHGWGINRSVWEAQAVRFSAEHEVINMDLPGFGRSGNNRQDFTIEAFGVDVSTVIETLGLDQVVLVGFSMGAPVVVETAAKFPQHIAGIVIVDDLHDVESPPPASEFDNIEELFMDLVISPSNDKLVSAGFYTRDPDTAYRRVLSMLQVTSRNGWRESLRDYLRWMNEDCIDSLRQLRVPVVAINAALQPTNVDAFRKYAPSFLVKIIPDTGHLLMWDAPDEFNRLLAESIEELVN
jgi:pimeloyl-ACP methyl ester carboxylesterase